MSEMERHYGRLIKIDKRGKSLDEVCKELCAINDYKKSCFDCAYWQTLLDIKDKNGLQKFYIIDDEIYEFIEHITFDDDYFTNIQKNPDGTYTLIASFYNGGTCLDEILEENL